MSKAKETGKNSHFALMLYRKSPLGSGLQSPVELLCAKKAISDLPMSHSVSMQVRPAARTRQQVDRPQAEAVRPINKNQQVHM